MGVNGRQKQFFVDSVDKTEIRLAPSIHAGLTQVSDFCDFTENAPGGTTNQKAASSSLAGRARKQKTYRFQQKSEKPKGGI